MNVFPGKVLFSSPKTQQLPEPLPDPNEVAAKERLRLAKRNRVGRKSTFLTGPGGVKDGLGNVNQPKATTQLGQ